MLAGGRTKYACIYAVAPRLLLKKFQLSHNRSLDGVVDMLNTKGLTEAGPEALLDVSDVDREKACVRARPQGRGRLHWIGLGRARVL